MYNTFKPEQPVGLMDFVKAARSCIPECSADALQTKMDNGEEMLLVDVRESSDIQHCSQGSPANRQPPLELRW